MRDNSKSCKGGNWNKGYSLVELIVIIAIIAVIGGVGVTVLAALPQGQVKSCAKELALEIEKTRTSSLGLEAASITITNDADGVHTQITVKKGGTEIVESREAGKAGVQISYVLGSGTEIPLGTDGLKITFNRSSGAFQYPKLVSGGAEATQTEYCTAIIIKKGGYERKITLVPLTGKLVQE